MTPETKQLIIDTIVPVVKKGEASLLLGAGFSIVNQGKHGQLPDGDRLRDELLKACGKVPGHRTSLKDAYLSAKRNLPSLPDFMESMFTVSAAPKWQQSIFSYVWNRIYTTNIDNVLDVAHDQAKKSGSTATEFVFFNYTDPGLVSSSIGSTPVVSIHGTVKELEQGFIFSNLEYGQVASRILDWQNELAAKIMVGGLIVVGNQMDEADIDSHLAARIDLYGESVGPARNWIVMPNPDPIKKENYEAAGYVVIDATGQEFFETIYAALPPKNISDLLLETVPAVGRKFASAKAMVWFREAFDPLVHEIEKAKRTPTILRHFLTGSHPFWPYITNSAHAKTSQSIRLTDELSQLMSDNATGAGVLHVKGPSGSGKTTAIRSALLDLSTTFKYIYEYNSTNGIDIDLFSSIVEKFSEKLICSKAIRPKRTC